MNYNSGIIKPNEWEINCRQVNSLQADISLAIYVLLTIRLWSTKPCNCLVRSIMLCGVKMKNKCHLGFNFLGWAGNRQKKNWKWFYEKRRLNWKIEWRQKEHLMSAIEKCVIKSVENNWITSKWGTSCAIF